MTLKQLEESVAHLPPDELARFREWFIAFDSQYWDNQIRSDADEGRLNALADAAIADHHADRTKPL